MIPYIMQPQTKVVVDMKQQLSIEVGALCTE